jgi:RecA/RadA recombinase
MIEMAVSTLQDDKKKALNLAIAQIEKSCGKGSIMRLGADQKVRVEAISTGAINLDAAIGVGGIPRGRVTEIYGPESSGKRRSVCMSSRMPSEMGESRRISTQSTRSTRTTRESSASMSKRC